ncbi:MAG: GNAT family N-acetyltransferase [Chitinophagaceae bacterium]
MLQPDFSPFPELSTERLLLRKLTVEDTPEIFFLRSDPAILQHLGKKPAATIKEAEEFIERITSNIVNNEGIMWAIVLKENPAKTIGTICFWRLEKEHYRAEIGYALSPAWWKKGIMKEAITKTLEYGFSKMGLHSVEARISSGNIPSAAILESTGFIKEAHFKEDFFFDGKFEDTIVYSRLQ